MYTLYKFHFLNGISEINQLFGDILIIWPAPVDAVNEIGPLLVKLSRLIAQSHITFLMRMEEFIR